MSWRNLYEEVRDVAVRALGAQTPASLDDLGIGDLLSSDVPSERTAALAVAEAQGRTGASTDVASRIALAGFADIPAAGLAVDLRSRQKGRRLVALLGAGPGTTAVVPVVEDGKTGSGWWSCPADALEIVESDLDPGYLVVRRWRAEEAGPLHREPLVRSTTVLARIRLAVAAETLGTVEQLLADAVAHATERVQFGKALATFQAVQHNLAWAGAEIAQLRTLLEVSLAGDPVGAPDPHLAALTKAMAGEVGRRVAQTTLQVTGALAFTWDYSHNARHRRLLALDLVGGSADTLYVELGREVRKARGALTLFELATLDPLPA
jgi:hypothetical protein